MKTTVEEIVNEIDDKTKQVLIDFDDEKWQKDVPSKPGWYLIKTNASIDKLMKCQKSIEYVAHTNIPETVMETSELQKAGIAIMQSGNENYVVYNGEADNLKARAREHVHGHRKTYCLGLSKYKNVLQHTNWFFYYVTMSNCRTIQNGKDKLLRLAVEQAWRAKHGWPILCRK